MNIYIYLGVADSVVSEDIYGMFSGLFFSLPGFLATRGGGEEE